MGFKKKKIPFIIKKKKIKLKEEKPLDLEEKIVYAICALGIYCFNNQFLDKEIRDWICSSFGKIKTLTLIPAFNKMIINGNHDISKCKNGRHVEYRVNRLFNLELAIKLKNLF